VDIATLFGVLAGFGVALGAVLLGPAPETFAHAPSLIFVLGGTGAALLLTCPADEVWRAVRTGIQAFSAKNIPAKDAVTAMVHLAEASYKEGIGALEKIQTTNPVLKKTAQLIAANADPALIRDTGTIEILALRRRHATGSSVFVRLAMYAPAIGMLGTFAWLVQMPAALKNPDALGQGMLAALVTTLYGCFLSLLVFLPVAGRITACGMEGEYRLNILFEGACRILENNNPTQVYERLSSFLTPEERAGAR
jgi:chemotaxis protein MotA